MKHHDIQLTGSISITGSLTVPVGTTDERPLNPKSGSIRMNTTTGVLEIYTAVSGAAWENVGEQTPAVASANIEYLVVAGGGGGGEGYYGGGGGAGGYLSSSLSSVESGSSFTITVGSGGTGGNTQSGTAGNGGDSSIAGATISTITATGGGGGANRLNQSSAADGGSGGGGAYPGESGGSGTVGQGNDGGTLTLERYGAGGGGASQAGQTPPGVYSGSPQNDSIGAPGGSGSYSSITGTSTPYAGGGGGGARATFSSNGIDGGPGGGGAGGAYVAGTAGTANTGGGGGGGGNDGDDGGAGGSGVVILAYNSGSINAVGGITGDAGNGRRYHQFNTGGTFKVGSTDDLKIVSSNLVLHLDAGNYASRGASTWSDLTANGYDATLVSSPALGQNFYYDFDGSADYGTFASAAHTALFAHTQGTIECWVNGDSFTSGTGRKTIFGTGHSSQTDRWCVIRVHQTNKLQMSINADGTSYGCNTTATLPSTSTWYHFAITYDGSSFAAYYDGVSQAINTTGGGWFNSVASDTLQVGAMDRGTSGNNYDPWDGKIAQVRVYSSALTAAEVAQNYEATKTNFV